MIGNGFSRRFFPAAMAILAVGASTVAFGQATATTGTSSPGTTRTPGSAGASGVPVLRADPSEMGIQIPKAAPKPAAGRRVLVNSDDDQLVVANVLVEVGSRFLVIMPDGRIQSVPSADVTVTDRPFVPATFKDLSDKLTAKFPGFKVKSTKHFIYVYNTSPLFYTGTSLILESLYPGLMNYLKSRKMAVADPPYPLVVVMFRTRKEWADYMHGMFADSSVAAFYDGVSNRVLMYEQSDIGEAAPEYALKQTISTVAHEGVHQILHNIGVQQRLSRWPMWISEGLPEYFAPTTVGKSLRWKGAGQVNDLRMYSIDEMLKLNRREDSAVDDIVFNDDLDANGYAWAWALSHYLGEKRREPFFKYVAEVAKLGPLEKMEESKQRLLFASHFGPDRAKLSIDMVGHLRKLPYVDPIENMTHYVVLIRYPLGGFVYSGYEVTSSPTEVNKTREQLRSRLPLEARQNATFEVKPFPTRTQAVEYARSLR
jgi:hypothetical protein